MGGHSIERGGEETKGETNQEFIHREGKKGRCNVSKIKALGQKKGTGEIGV